MPMRKAMYHALLGENLTGQEAVAAGLVNEALPAALLEARVTEVAQQLLAKNWETLKATKDAMRRVREMTYDDAEDYLIRAQEALNWHDKSDGRHRGMNSFSTTGPSSRGCARTTNRSDAAARAPPPLSQRRAPERQRAPAARATAGHDQGDIQAKPA
jgi:hypothetical protein